jgi:response regulator RpfG family c-di-GMP phosphodiesterase
VIPRRPSILCVDDEAVILLAMRQELSRRFGDRYGIETALGAEEASAVIDETEAEGGCVALVICDWFMAGERGDAFLAGLRARRPEIKSILMTGQADGEAILRAREEARISACIQKPWRAEVLARAVEECLGRNESVSG